MKQFLTKNILCTFLMLGTSPLVYAAEPTTGARSLRELAMKALSCRPEFLHTSVSEAMHATGKDNEDLDTLRSPWCLAKFNDSNSQSCTLIDPETRFRSAKFNPDNTIEAFAVCNDSLQTWNADIFTGLRGIKLESVKSAILSPNDTYVAVALKGDRVQVWNLHTRMLLSTFEPKSGRSVKYLFCSENSQNDGAQQLAFSPDSTLLATVSNATVTRIWDLATNECLNEFNRGQYECPTTLAFSDDGHLFATGSTSGSVTLYDPRNVGPHEIALKWAQEGNYKAITALAFDKSNTFLASASLFDAGNPFVGATLHAPSSIKLWAIATGLCLRSFGIRDNLYTSLAFSHDGNALITSSVYNAPFEGGSTSPWAILRSTPKGSVQLWDTYTGSCLKFFGHIGSKATAVRLNHDSSLLAVIQDDKILHRKPIVLPAQLAALTPEELRGLFDTLFTGERNEHWPALVAKISGLQFIAK